jgi:hypothetical protein
LDSVLGFPGELCIELEITEGSGSERSWECRRNTCEDDNVDCDCAGALCPELDPRTNCGGPGNEELTLRCSGG